MRSRGTHICQRNLTDSRSLECSLSSAVEREREREGQRSEWHGGRAGRRSSRVSECLQHFSVASSFFLSLCCFFPARFFFGLFCVISITTPYRPTDRPRPASCQFAFLLRAANELSAAAAAKQVSIDSSPRISHGVAPLNYRRSPSMINETAALN